MTECINSTKALLEVDKQQSFLQKSTFYAGKYFFYSINVYKIKARPYQSHLSKFPENGLSFLLLKMDQVHIMRS